jgi:hypothetical protein
MLITQTYSWPVTNWPSTSPSAQYALFRTYPDVTPTLVQTVSTTSAALSYEDTLNLAFQVRPTDGTLYGPEVTSFVVGYLPCRAYLRQKIRYALADQTNVTGGTINWPDSEINTYIEEAFNELSILFPKDADTTIMMQPPTIVNGQTVGTRAYALPTDCYSIRSVEYVDQSGRMHLYLKEKPFRGGESTATTYIGYPKLGIMLTPLAGRFYPGHYDMYEGNINLDWDPSGDGDYLHLRYAARYPIPSDDATLFTIQQEDMELLSLYAQMKCWIRVEGQDVRLSRWRGKADGGRRDDLPTETMSKRVKQLYDQRINDRRAMRVMTRRLVRR